MSNKIKKCLETELARSPKTTEEPPKLYPDINEAQKTIDNIFKDFVGNYRKVDLKDAIDFEDTNKCHDWKNYVGEFVDVWSNLTLNEKKIIYIFCEKMADKEEWD